MEFSINYDEIGDIGKFLLEKSEEMDNIYSEIIDICVAIEENWKSEDSSVYISKMVSYLKEIIGEERQVIDAGQLLNELSSNYNEKDNKWEKDLLREDKRENE